MNVDELIGILQRSHASHFQALHGQRAGGIYFRDTECMGRRISRRHSSRFIWKVEQKIYQHIKDSGGNPVVLLMLIMYTAYVIVLL